MEIAEANMRTEGDAEFLPRIFGQNRDAWLQRAGTGIGMPPTIDTLYDSDNMNLV